MRELAQERPNHGWRNIRGAAARCHAVTRLWLAVVLSACGPRFAPAPAAPASQTVTIAAPREPVAAPTFEDPPAPPCPTSGWATAETLAGAWQGGHSNRLSSADPPPSYLQLRVGRQVRLRHDYYPDGTASLLELTRFHELADTERRAQQTGQWRVGPSGELDLSWRTPSFSRTLRERVWIAVDPGGVPILARRTFERDADGVWRGARRFEETGFDGRASGSETRLEMRFSPPLTPDARVACEVEITRSLTVWGRGKPGRWTSRARHRCEFVADRVLIDAEPVRWPDHDERLLDAYAQFDPSSLVWLAPDVLHDDHFERDMPRRRSRPADPPLSWQEVGSVERCQSRRLDRAGDGEHPGG